MPDRSLCVHVRVCVHVRACVHTHVDVHAHMCLGERELVTTHDTVPAVPVSTIPSLALYVSTGRTPRTPPPLLGQPRGL